MAATTAGVSAGITGASDGPTTGGWVGELQEKMKAKAAAKGAAANAAGADATAAAEAMAAAEGGNESGVAPHGPEAHTGGGASVNKPKKRMWGGFGGHLKAMGGGLSGLFYKMPAAGKYKNSPIEKNFGSKEHRGFGHNEPIANPKTGETPLDLKSFGVGSLTGGTAAKPRSKTGSGGKFNK